MRGASLLLTLSGLGLFGAVQACGSSTKCGPGTEQIGDLCIVGSAGGAGGATSSSTSSTTSSTGSSSSTTSSSGAGGKGGAMPTPPTFAGVVSASPASDTSLFVTWAPAMDAKTPADQLRYAIFVATQKGGEHFNAPDAIVPHGGLFGTVDGLTSGSDYFVVVRAINEAGAEDQNTIEIKATPQKDTTPPTFNGAKSATPANGGKVTVAWDAASDDHTAKDAIRYLVWSSATTPVDTSGAPTTTTSPGALTTDLVLPGPMTDYHFVVRAEDAAGNVDANTKEVDSKPGPDTMPPTFGGCKAVNPKDAGTITATWDAASDDTTPVASLSYVIYAFSTAGPHPDVSVADAKIQYDNGVLQGDIGGLKASTQYWLVCHAKDLSGNEDKNDNELMTTTPADTDPPVFGAGALVAALDTPSTTAIKLTWPAATDNQTPQASIEYDVFSSATPGGENLQGMPLVKVVGQTSTIVMTTSATRTYFVVVAKDGAANVSAPLPEANARTDVSFATDIQPIFNASCNNCHSVNTLQNTPYLDKTFTPGSLVGYYTAGQAAVSKLYTDVAYQTNAMPPVGLGLPQIPPAQQQLIADWINEGGQNN